MEKFNFVIYLFDKKNERNDEGRIIPTTFRLETCSEKEAETWAEPIRIAFPDCHVNIEWAGGSFICYTTWEDQMKEFIGYRVFTPMGERLKAEALVKNPTFFEN